MYKYFLLKLVVKYGDCYLKTKNDISFYKRDNENVITYNIF